MLVSSADSTKHAAFQTIPEAQNLHLEYFCHIPSSTVYLIELETEATSSTNTLKDIASPFPRHDSHKWYCGQHQAIGTTISGEASTISAETLGVTTKGSRAMLSSTFPWFLLHCLAIHTDAYSDAMKDYDGVTGRRDS